MSHSILLTPVQALGRIMNNLMRGMAMGNAWQALRHAALLLGSIWIVFLPLLVLTWFAVLRREGFPGPILLVGLADSLIFVVACFLGVRFRQPLPLTWAQVLTLVLVGMLFLPLLAVVFTRTLPFSAASSLIILRFYYGWFFDAYTFTVLGLLAGLSSYQD